MPGRSDTRDKLNKTLREAGMPEIPPGESLTPFLAQVKTLRAAERKEAAQKKKEEAEQRDARLKAAGLPGSNHQAPGPGEPGQSDTPPGTGELTTEDIRKVLKGILLSPRETGSARIAAAEKLLQLKGDAPQYQKALVEVVLTGYRPDQYNYDKESRAL